MTATAEMISDVRDMTDEPTQTTYDDAKIKRYIEKWPLMDVKGQPPYFVQGVTIIPNQNWTPTYDLNRAAAEIWDLKAAALSAQSIDYSADGASFTASQALRNARTMAQTFRARRSAGVILFQPGPQSQSDGLDRDDHN